MQEHCPFCRSHLPNQVRDLLPPGTLLRQGAYHIEYPIGRGGFGVTYKAVHTGFQSVVAIKEYFPRDLANRSGLQLVYPIDKERIYLHGMEKVQHEGQVLYGLNHPNIVRVTDVFQENGTVYLVMEYLPGRPLSAVLHDDSTQTLPPHRVEQIIDSIVSALALVHSKNLFHLDLKPGNIMVQPDDRIVLIDFGLLGEFPSPNGVSSHEDPNI